MHTIIQSINLSVFLARMNGKNSNGSRREMEKMEKVLYSYSD